MKIPNPLIYTVADVLGTYYFSHTKLDTLFGEAGFPGDPPPGNCIKKCQAWMKRANEDAEETALGLLSKAIEEFMNKDHSENADWMKGVNRVREALAKSGYKYDWDGIIAITPKLPPPPILEDIRVPTEEIASLNRRRFAVAFSFPGEHRSFIEAVAGQLTVSLGRGRLLYDHYHEAEFARPDLDIYLPRLYLEESDLICVFLCRDYAKKRWCNLEWRFIRQLIATAEQGRIMFLSFDEVGAIPELGILSGDGYLSIRNRLPNIIAERIAERLSQALSFQNDASP